MGPKSKPTEHDEAPENSGQVFQRDMDDLYQPEDNDEDSTEDELQED